MHKFTFIAPCMCIFNFTLPGPYVAIAHHTFHMIRNQGHFQMRDIFLSLMGVK